MAQLARPTADVNVGGWEQVGYAEGATGLELFSSVDEEVVDDADAIFMADSFGDACVLRFGELQEPAAGTVTLRVRYRRLEASANTYMSVELLDGETIVASRTILVDGEAYLTADLVLTSAERDAIADWANLRVRLDNAGEAPEAGGGIPLGALTVGGDLLTVEDEVLVDGDA